MKKTILFLAFLLCSYFSKGQSKTFVCSFYGDMVSQEIIQGKLPPNFTSNDEAIKVVERIIEPTGLKRNFIVLEDSRVANACALISNEKRYVLYNNRFMEMVKNVTNTDWAAVSIMAHEVGHHLQGHTAESGGSRPSIELEADEYSGWIMYLLGASLQDSQVAMSKIASEQDGTTHPGRFKRLNAIQIGWSKAAKKYPRQERVPITRPNITYNAKFLHSANKISNKRNGNNYEFNLYLSASDEELRNIESVTYHLHPTFNEPDVTVTDSSNGFPLRLTVWGQFDASVTVRYKDGTTRELERYLSF